MNLFYTKDIIEPITTLSKDESKHIVRVLRKSKGDVVYFTDGLGYIFKCVIVEANPQNCTIEIVEKTKGEEERDYNLHIAIAPTKNISRFEWFLEKSTEIGIDRIIPVICSHSERKEVKTERLNKVITSAMKQSLKSHQPEIAEKVSFMKLVDIPFEGEKFIAYISDDVSLELSKAYTSGQNVIILIGPEGDFSPGEIELAISKGYIPISLGTSRLRTETAGIVACHTINLLNS
ncbi:MAG: 16S rRNA (uracil(1498)-N(3))-methyltransferase [Bacteroidetes bacterium]|jgi:16S rRNA (uracil1498-N3)-methyltransferase|nr:16S rRNA (uracil(1498)-N(3))-methyltransferase [Bacteroidota bacterium]|tara:strand:- start:56 stop:757 length:702 start_codon:yes stop_codon:yes gene_type:complete